MRRPDEARTARAQTRVLFDAQSEGFASCCEAPFAHELDACGCPIELMEPMELIALMVLMEPLRTFGTYEKGKTCLATAYE